MAASSAVLSKGVLVALALALFPVCSSRRQRAPDLGAGPRRVPPSSPAPVERPFRPRPEVRAATGGSMVRMLRTAEEMGRRAGAGLPLAGPAGVIDAAAGQIPADRYPPSFKSHLGQLREHLQGMSEKSGQDSKRTFNEMIDRCLACHREYGPRLMGRIFNVRLR